MRKPSRSVHGIRTCCALLTVKLQLRDVWDAEISKEGEPARINIMTGLSKMTLDAIGLAGESLCPSCLPSVHGFSAQDSTTISIH